MGLTASSGALEARNAAPSDGAALLPSQLGRIVRSEAGAIVGGWTVVAVLFAGHSYLSYAADGRPITVLQAAWWSAAEWYTWALLTPVVASIVRRVRQAEWPRARSLGALVALGLLVAVLQVVLEYGADQGVVLLSGDRDLSVRVWLAGGVRGAVLDLAYLLPRKIGFSVVTFWAIVGVVAAADYYRLYRDRELRAARLEGALAGAQLQALQAQLQPHFLFNTLNAIASLIPESPAAAEEMVESLADLLRASLRDGREHEIPLEREMEILDQYLRIQELRFQDRLRVRRALPAELAAALVPPLLLQPLVENAIKHGVAPRPGGGLVSVRAEGSRGQLVIVVEDDGPGFTGAARDGAGLGLANTRARLARLYGDDSALVVGDRPGGGASVTVRLPLRSPAPVRPQAGTVAAPAARIA